MHQPPEPEPKPVAKKPAASLSEEPGKSRGTVVQEIPKKGGWKKQQLQTAKGRCYWKWIHPNGT